MLQRAASNAYSWWWASHIRTKQSKWLEQSLQDMEEKVHYMLKLISEDGDSFAKRAEMYYKRRPELITFVEESYRAYRALAERYDHISTELQNANTTIASVFPEQVQFSMDDEDECAGGPMRVPKNFPQIPASNVPKVPKGPTKDLKGIISTASKKFQNKNTSPPKRQDGKGRARAVPKSGLTKNEALEEIDKVQKDILASQTVKEFVKSSYEKQLEKYYGIEEQIKEMQQKVSGLQDEFGLSSVIEDDEARTLMAEAALKSCQDTLTQLEEKQVRSAMEARAESKRIEDVTERLMSLKSELNQGDENAEERKSAAEAESGPDHEALREKIKEHIESGSKGPITVTELAEKIDTLVNKVINLESAASSQTALINSLRTETDDLQTHIRSLEGDKASLINDANNLSKRLTEMEEKLRGVQDLDKSVVDQYNNMQTHFTEAKCSLDHLSEKLQDVKPDEELENEPDSVTSEQILEKGLEKLQKVMSDGDMIEPEQYSSSDEEIETETPMQNPKPDEELEKEVVSKEKDSKNKKSKEEEEKKEVVVEKDKEVVDKCEVSNPENQVQKLNSAQLWRSPVITEPKRGSDDELEVKKANDDDDIKWQQMLLSGVEDKDQIMLKEYTTILRKYKDMKKKLSDTEKSTEDILFEKTLEIQELQTTIAKRDQEYQALRLKVNLLLAKIGENEETKPNATDSTTDSNDSKKNEEQVILPEEDEDIKLIMIDQPQSMSPIEEKLRLTIDAILDENLHFWLRFSTSFHQVQKFRTEVQDLQHEIKELKQKQRKKQEPKPNSSSSSGLTSTSSFSALDLKSDIRAIYKHLCEKQTELTVWMERSGVLKEELQRRFSSVCKIQEDITMALKEGVEQDTIKFSSHQAAKFQGEVLNMKQENNKVREELQAGLDHATALSLEVEKTLNKLDDELSLSEGKNVQPQLTNSVSRGRVPLRSFLFGVKQKKKKSIFDCMHQIRKQTDSITLL